MRHIKGFLQKFFNEVPRSQQFLKLFTVFRQGNWTKFYERVFLWTIEKDSIESLTEKLTQFIWNTLLYCLCRSKAKIWACCCCKAWITFAELMDLLILYNERLFWVSASVLRSLSSNLSVRSSQSFCLWLIVLFLTCAFSWR